MYNSQRTLLSPVLRLTLYQRILQVMYNNQRSLSTSSFATHRYSEDPPGHGQLSALSFYLLFCTSPFIRGSSRSWTTVSALFLSPLLRLTLYQRILQVMYNNQCSLSISSFATHPLSEDPQGHVQQSALSFYLLFCNSPFIRGFSRSSTTVSALFLSPLLQLTLYQRILQAMYNSQCSLSVSSFTTYPLSEDPPGHVQKSAISFYFLFCYSPFIRGFSRSCTTVSALFLSPLA